MKVWITRYALSRGIYETDAKVCENFKEMIEDKNRRNTYYHRKGDQWHDTEESAVKKAEDMRTKKIKSLQEKINKLEKLNFQKKKEGN